MKAIIALTLVIFAVINAPQQPPSYAFIPYRLDTTDIDLSLTGPEQEWDLSNAHFIDSGNTWHFSPVGDIPYKQLYPQANYMLTNDSMNFITYLHGDESCIGYCGDVNFAGDVFVRAIQLNTVDTEIKYPVYYGSKMYYNNKHYTNTSKKDSTLSVVRTSNNVQTDASGTMTGPDGRKYNVARIKYQTYQTTKIYKLTGTDTVYWYKVVNNSINYRWVCPEVPYGFLCRCFIDRVIVTQEGYPPYTYTVKQAWFNQRLNMAPEVNFNMAGLHVTKDMVSTVYVAYECKQPEEGVIQVINMNGQTVFREQVSSQAAPSVNEQELNVSILPPGAYIITYNSTNTRGVTKWIKK